MTAYWCERAWLPDGIVAGVLVEVGAHGTITRVATVDTTPPGAERLRGLVFPGFANVHSHAFHRALRGRTHSSGGSFWTWRQRMYAVADRLDPDGYLALATAVYAEMAVAGVSCVGEFHYLHHAPDGRPYADPNVMGEALRAAAANAGIRLTLLDTCYLRGGIGRPVEGVQQRFSDGTAEGWAHRVGRLAEDATTRIGGAIHSVRAVPADEIAEVGKAIPADRPLHVHLSEQPAENEECERLLGRTPTGLLAQLGVLDERLTAVHATHLAPRDISLLGEARVTACFCPTTEADLADGIGPARELLDAGCALALGSDQHAVVDPLLEARALEHGERLRSGERGRLGPGDLAAALTSAGHASLGWPEAGRIAVGSPADLVSVAVDTVRTAGSLPEQLLLTATASDVDTVVVGGRVIARGGRHERLGDVGRLLSDAITPLWPDTACGGEAG